MSAETLQDSPLYTLETFMEAVSFMARTAERGASVSLDDGLSEYAKHSLQSIKNEGARKVVRRYLLALKSNSRKDRTIEIAATHMSFFANEVDKSLDKVRRSDLEAYLANVRNAKTGEPVGKATMELRRGVIKQFYKWYLGRGTEFPSFVKWIRSKRTPKERTKDEMLIKDEVKKLIEVANGTREKALVATLYESGLRIAEFLSLRIQDVKFKEGGYAIIVLPEKSANLKTGRREVAVVMCVPYLQLWVESHPSRDEPTAYLWPSEYGDRKDKPVDDTTVLYMLRRLGKRAGIQKKITSHLLRHSRATEVATRGWNESLMRTMFGWTRTSQMPSIYTHLANSDVEDRVLVDNGLKLEPEPVSDPLAPLVCARCGKRNPATVYYCLGCGTVVNVERATEIERRAGREGKIQAEYMMDPTKMDRLLKDPKVQQFLILMKSATKT